MPLLIIIEFIKTNKYYKKVTQAAEGISKLDTNVRDPEFWSILKLEISL